ncbi:MAG TPA: ABC transporter substrate-binding protein [Fibrobacteraceae bacterium]|nr:ABC transporter substrate-binding protein [Fibrobacteraceae bacterium]
MAIFLCLSLFACSDEKPELQMEAGSTVSSYTRRATGFQIDSIPGFQVLTIVTPWGGQGLRLRWLLRDSVSNCPDCEVPDSLLSLPVLRIPLHRVVALSSTHLALLAELGALDRVVGVSRLDLVQDSTMRAKLKAQGVAEVGYGPSIQVESVLKLVPDAVFTFGVGDPQMDDYGALQMAHLPVLVLSEWMEPHPLGRLEWIRLMGVLLHREALADSLFLGRVRSYDSLVEMVQHCPDTPTVMTGAPSGQTWYLTGGRNYFAALMRDAGARYFWTDDTTRGGIQSSFERVFSIASEANFWLNPGYWSSREEALAADSRVQLFSAWKQGHVFQHGKNFWELGMVRPDLVLTDLVAILHPEALPNHKLVFYQALGK